MATKLNLSKTSEKSQNKTLIASLFKGIAPLNVTCVYTGLCAACGHLRAEQIRIQATQAAEGRADPLRMQATLCNSGPL